MRYIGHAKLLLVFPKATTSDVANAWDWTVDGEILYAQSPDWAALSTCTMIRQYSGLYQAVSERLRRACFDCAFIKTIYIRGFGIRGLIHTYNMAYSWISSFRSKNTLVLLVKLVQLLLHSLLQIEALHHTAPSFPLLNLCLDFCYDFVNLGFGVVSDTKKRHLCTTSDTVG